MLHGGIKWCHKVVRGGKWGIWRRQVIPHFLYLTNTTIAEKVRCSGKLLSESMFLGEYHHSIDDKGRIALPVKFRAAFATGTVITRGLDGSLFLFPQEEWDKLALKLANLPLGKANTRAFARLMLAGAMDALLDKQGRVVVPEYLRDYAAIKKNIVVAGLYNRLEIWDSEKWSAYKQQTEGEAVELAEQLGELGL